MKTFAITTFGCQMNVSDSERVAAVCRSMGFKDAEKDSIADLYIMNTCSIRQKAEDRVLGMGKKFFNFKKERPEVKIVLTGCMAKRDIRQGFEKSESYQEKYEGKLKKQMPWLDHVLEITDIHKLPEVLGVKVTDTVSDFYAVKPKYDSKFQAFVPISTGCNKFCTFCIVPFTRGKEVSRDFDQIFNEVKDLVDRGYKEITLLGQNVNSWRSTNILKTPITSMRNNLNSEISVTDANEEEFDFTILMERLADIPGDFWLRFTSSHPYDINPRLIDVVASKKNIAKQFHFALQSGSDSVLKRMNRYYTSKEFVEKVTLIKEKIAGVGITTDVIVGFCGETDQEFLETVEACKIVGFDQIFISEYSQRQGTIASKFYQDDIDAKIKSDRKIMLDNVLKEGLKENNQKLIGTIQKVLIHKNKSKNKEGLFGRTTQAKDVLIKFENSTDAAQYLRIGEFVNVKITGFNGFRLEGALEMKIL